MHVATVDTAPKLIELPAKQFNDWDLPGNGTDFAGCTWTDARGESLVPIAQVGWMTLRLVHMTRPQTQAHDYESFLGELLLRCR